MTFAVQHSAPEAISASTCRYAYLRKPTYTFGIRVAASYDSRDQSVLAVALRAGQSIRKCGNQQSAQVPSVTLRPRRT